MTSDRSQLDHVTRELAAREPIFHRPEFGTTRDDFDRMMADDFWEVRASGQKYSREFVLDALEQRHESLISGHFVVSDSVARWPQTPTWSDTNWNKMAAALAVAQLFGDIPRTGGRSSITKALLFRGVVSKTNCDKRVDIDVALQAVLAEDLA